MKQKDHVIPTSEFIAVLVKLSDPDKATMGVKLRTVPGQVRVKGLLNLLSVHTLFFFLLHGAAQMHRFQFQIRPEYCIAQADKKNQDENRYQAGRDNQHSHILQHPIQGLLC